MREDIPSQWLPYLSTRGLNSYRRLADRAGMSHETARRVVLGRNVRPHNLERVAEALGISVERVHALRDEPVPDRSREYVPPPAAVNLTEDERDVISRLISVMTSGRSEPTASSASSRPDEFDLAADRIGQGGTMHQQRTRQQDAAGEHPDPPGPDGGA